MQLQLILAEMLKPEVPNDEFVFLTDEDAQRLVGLSTQTSNMTRSAPTAAEFDGTEVNLYQALGFSGTNFFIRLGVTFDGKDGYLADILVSKALTSSHTYGRIEDGGCAFEILRKDGPVAITQPPRLASTTLFQSLANRPLLDRVRAQFK